jgi:hypothetical protein
MQVLIVALTRVGQSICVGAIDEGGTSRRLFDTNWNFHTVASQYQIGQIWEMTLLPRNNALPPHIEDVSVLTREYIGMVNSISETLNEIITPWAGPVTELFEGMLYFTGNSRGYIEAPRIPTRSTWFWIPDQNLYSANINGKIYYRYWNYELSYVGVAEAIPVIMANKLVRVSLARWWKPNDAGPTFPDRCYLQLSGWY